MDSLGLQDPRHYGVRLSALYTGGNFIQVFTGTAVTGTDSDSVGVKLPACQERGERNKEVEVRASDILDTYDSSEES